jgi:hypothetical protein
VNYIVRVTVASGGGSGSSTSIVTTSTFTFASGTDYANENATAGQAVTGTLPTASASGRTSLFNANNGSAANTGVLGGCGSAAGQYIIYNGALSASGGCIFSGGAAGDWGNFTGVDTTHWAFTPRSGTWKFQAATPVPSPAGGTYSSTQSVTLTTALGTVICYNTTGAPATNGTTGCTTGTLYTTAISVSSSETLYFVAGGTGYVDSAVGNAVYVISAGPTLVQSKSCINASGAQASCAFAPPGNTAGDMIDVCVATYYTATVISPSLTVTDTRNTYAAGQAGLFVQSTNQYTLGCAHALNVGAGANTVNIANGGTGIISYQAVYIMEFSGVATSSAVDGHNSQGGQSSATIEPGSFSITSGDLVVGFAQTNTPTIGAVSPYAAANGSDTYTMPEWAVISSTSANPTWTDGGGTRYWAANGEAFKP